MVRWGLGFSRWAKMCGHTSSIGCINSRIFDVCIAASTPIICCYPFDRYIFYFWFGLRKLEGLKIREYNQRNDRMAGYADSLEEELDALVYSIENKQNDVGSYT
jgi:hypothetical protein